MSLAAMKATKVNMPFHVYSFDDSFFISFVVVVVAISEPTNREIEFRFDDFIKR